MEGLPSEAAPGSPSGRTSLSSSDSSQMATIARMLNATPLSPAVSDTSEPGTPGYALGASELALGLASPAADRGPDGQRQPTTLKNLIENLRRWYRQKTEVSSSPTCRIQVTSIASGTKVLSDLPVSRNEQAFFVTYEETEIALDKWHADVFAQHTHPKARCRGPN